LTREEILELMKAHGVDESDIDMVAIQISAGALTDLENLTLKHEIRREAIFREVERRRKKRAKQQRGEGATRINGKAKA
jgi:hypothetical protein